MKILQICNKAPFPANDGSSIAMANMALGLISSGAEVRIISLNTRKHNKSSDYLPEQFTLNKNYFIFDCNTSPTLMGAFRSLFSKNSYFLSRFYFRSFEDIIIRQVDEFNPDIIQFEGLSMCVYLDKLKNSTSAKNVLRAHNIEYRIWERHVDNLRNPFKKWYILNQLNKLKKFEINVFNSSDAVVAITKEDEFQINKLSKSKTHVALTGIQLKNYTTADNDDKNKNSVFHFGGMDWIPNQEAVDWFLENCWDKILQEIPDCNLIIAGRNIPKKYFQLNVKNICIIPDVPHSEEIYNNYNVMIVPLLSGSGLRIKLIEGMSYGKPIVSTTIGAEGIPYEAEKELLVSDDAEGFSNNVIRLIKDENLTLNLSKNARNFAKNKFNLDIISSELVSFYKILKN